MNPSYPAIETYGLKKVYGDKVAVKDLSLIVERGEVFGFLGPNGAGKTTSVKMLLDLITPTSGDGKLFGASIKDPHIRTRIGFLPEHFRFHDWMRADQFLSLHADLYRMSHGYAKKRILDLLELVGLTPHATKRLSEYSKGMLQRIGLAQALLNEPELIILDEPTSGLDPVGRLMVRDIIHDLRERGTTIFLNSHLLSEVEVTCDRVAFIKLGEVIHTSSLQKLMEGEFSLEVRARSLSAEIVSGLKRWCRDVRVDGDLLSMNLTGEENLPKINRYLVEKGADVYALRPKHISLEDLFIQIVGRDGGL